MDMFLEQFGFGFGTQEVEAVMGGSSVLFRLAGDAGHAFVLDSGRVVLLGFVNLNEWGGPSLRYGWFQLCAKSAGACLFCSLLLFQNHVHVLLLPDLLVLESVMLEKVRNR